METERKKDQKSLRGKTRNVFTEDLEWSEINSRMAKKINAVFALRSVQE